MPPGPAPSSSVYGTLAHTPPPAIDISNTNEIEVEQQATSPAAPLQNPLPRDNPPASTPPLCIFTHPYLDGKPTILYTTQNLLTFVSPLQVLHAIRMDMTLKPMPLVHRHRRQLNTSRLRIEANSSSPTFSIERPSCRGRNLTSSWIFWQHTTATGASHLHSRILETYKTP